MWWSFMVLTKDDCIRPFNKQFSEEVIPQLTELFSFFRKHATSPTSILKKLHLGYTCMNDDAYDFVASCNPWVERFRQELGLSKRLNFLETNGIHKPKFMPHIDGRDGNPQVMLNIPIQNCDENTTTTWWQPLEAFEPFLAAENYSTGDTKRGATPHLPEYVPRRKIAEYTFTDRAALFRSDVYHSVDNHTDNDTDRIMFHWWFPEDAKFDLVALSLEGDLDEPVP
jgi:hypothetical protein